MTNNRNILIEAASRAGRVMSLAIHRNKENGVIGLACISAPPREPQYDRGGQQKSAKPKAKTQGGRDFEAARMRGVRNGISRRNGNCHLTALGDRAYTYDAENRLASVAATNGIPVLANTYDHRHRRTRKTTSAAVHDFVYDGWNLLRETTLSNGVSSTVDYFWGVDISGSLQGAGGVGGLIAASIDGQFYFTLYDNNGNVTEYIDESGVVRAHYEYSPFGEIIAQSGDMADVFRFRFSTKYHDPETGHYYYGRRFYVPELGRWLNRDPIEERGGLSLYGFVGNRPLDRWDYLGLKINLDGLPQKCGRCSVKWEETPGMNGADATTEFDFARPWYSYEECGGRAKSGRQRYRLKVQEVTCSAVIRIDVDPHAGIGKEGVTFAAHELKHVRAWSDALDWLLSEVSSKVSGHCRCNIDEGLALMEMIKFAAGYKGRIATLRVDAEDYVRDDNRADGQQKKARAASLELALEKQLNAIDAAAKKWRESE